MNSGLAPILSLLVPTLDTFGQDAAIQVSTLPTVPTNTVQVPNTTGTVTDSGSVYTGLLGAISGYIYRTGKL